MDKNRVRCILDGGLSCQELGNKNHFKLSHPFLTGTLWSSSYYYLVGFHLVAFLDTTGRSSFICL
jgi:hypothetical protein